MRKTFLGVSFLFLGLGCAKDQACRDGTVTVTAAFADGPQRVDGIAMRYKLDDGPVVDLKPAARPSGANQGTLALAVKDYASHKQLLLHYAPTKAGIIVGPWQQRSVALMSGCTAIDFVVAIASDDAGAPDGLMPTLDAQAPIDTRSEALVDVRGNPDAPSDQAIDTQGDAAAVPTEVDAPLLGADAPDVAMPETAAVDASTASDVPVAPDRDAPTESIADLRPVPSTLDAALALDVVLDVSPGPGPDLASDGRTDLGQVGCLIDSTFYAPGVPNPANPCQTCQPTLSGSTWTAISNGTGCGSGQVCSAGICRLGCWLDGSYYPASATKPGNTCQHCNPTLSAGTWTKESDGTSCGSGQVCNAGLCGTGCWIDGTLWASGAVNPANPCQTCQPGTSDTAWSNSASGASCGPGLVCNSGNCQSGCWIDGTLYTSGAAKPGNPCQTCQPTISLTAWSNANSTTACSAGQVCTAGACQAGCSIGGTYYLTDALNPSNACQACQPGTSTTAWTNLTAGTSCDAGKVCAANACQAGCWISGAYYVTSALNPSNACQSCQPGTSTTAWKNVTDGTGCGTGKVCSGGTCGTATAGSVSPTTLAIGSKYCDGAQSGSSPVTVTGSAGATYQAVITNAVYYKINGNSSFTGTIPSGGSASFNVTWTLPPRDQSFPGVGALPAYADTLTITYVGQTFVVPISMSVDGSVLTPVLASGSAHLASGPQFTISATNSPPVTPGNPQPWGLGLVFSPNPAYHFSVITAGSCAAADACWIKYDGSAICSSMANTTLTLSPGGGHICYAAPLTFSVTGCN